jgi:hypothetical protein
MASEFLSTPGRPSAQTAIVQLTFAARKYKLRRGMPDLGFHRAVTSGFAWAGPA